MDYKNMDAAKKEEFDSKYSWTAFYFLILLITMCIITCCFITMLWCAKDSIDTAIDVIDASADFIVSNKTVMLVPNIHYIFTIAFSIAWLGTYFCVISLNEIKADTLIP